MNAAVNKAADDIEVAVADTMTVLTSRGKRLTKLWRADGTIEGYDDAKNYRIQEYKLTGIEGLHRLLERLAPKSTSCAIRGAFVGAGRAQELDPPEHADHYHRNNKLFAEVPHHWFLTDVDGYRPEGIDPCLEPVRAIDQYIQRCLPECFQGVSYVWQLSSSAGAPGKEGVLKAHLWFWSRVKYTGRELTAWARKKNVELDVSVLRRVQPNYTAAPVFEEGVADPVPVRMGFEQGWAADEVDLVIDEWILESLGDEADDENGVDLVDPKTKPGLIGLFCRTYSIEEVIENWLPDVFEFQDGSERRLNWIGGGGGATGGAFVSDCREYVVNMHNTDPMQGRACNKWDLVRHYVHGAADEGADPFELAIVSQRPSHQAMLAMVAELPEVKAGLRAERAEAAGRWKGRVEDAADEFELREVCAEIKNEEGLDVVAIAQLEGLIQSRFKDLIGTKMPIAAVRSLIGSKGRKGASSTKAGAPGWVKPWVYVTDGDYFFDLVTKEKVSERGFNAKFNRNMKPFADPQTDIVPSASTYALNEWHLQVVSHLAYVPTCGDVFEMLGFTWANLYRADSAPEVCDDWKVAGSAGWNAVEAVKKHLRRLLPNRRERRLFVAWLAHNVKKPGVKIRWAPYLCGQPGDGKSFFADLLSLVMGAQQVRTVSGSTLESSFTDWAIGYAVIVIEEMKQHGHNRYEVMNRVKPMITNGTIEIHPKGKASYTAPNTANYMVLSNYIDGAPIDANDRRYMFLVSALGLGEIIKLTESGEYKELYDQAAMNAGALRGWLLSLDLDDEFDADGRAPDTDARSTVIELTRTETESIARDLIQMTACGVTPGAVSSAHLVNLIKDKLGDEADVKTTRINSLLAKLGFRFYGRKKWEDDARRIWISGPDRDWDAIKAELDLSIGRTADFSGDV